MREILFGNLDDALYKAVIVKERLARSSGHPERKPKILIINHIGRTGGSSLHFFLRGLMERISPSPELPHIWLDHYQQTIQADVLVATRNNLMKESALELIANANLRHTSSRIADTVRALSENIQRPIIVHIHHPIQHNILASTEGTDNTSMELYTLREPTSLVASLIYMMHALFISKQWPDVDWKNFSQSRWSSLHPHWFAPFMRKILNEPKFSETRPKIFADAFVQLHADCLFTHQTRWILASLMAKSVQDIHQIMWSIPGDHVHNIIEALASANYFNHCTGFTYLSDSFSYSPNAIEFLGGSESEIIPPRDPYKATQSDRESLSLIKSTVTSSLEDKEVAAIAMREARILKTLLSN